MQDVRGLAMALKMVPTWVGNVNKLEECWMKPSGVPTTALPKFRLGDTFKDKCNLSNPSHGKGLLFKLRDTLKYL